ncbi:MAG: adenylosuccinate lyase [Candidatus Promineifilaceae bacterium]
MFDHTTYISPFTWRYASEEMRHIWSEVHRRRLMRRIWVSLAAAQHEAGLVSAEQVADLRRFADKIDIERAAEFEQRSHHDVMAEIQTFSEQAIIGGSILHWGATSADIIDNADVLRLREALNVLVQRLGELLEVLAESMEQTADLPVMAYTHIQPAEPTTHGYRLAMYGQDLLLSYGSLHRLGRSLRGKGMKGAVGTQASFSEILAGSGMSAEAMESKVMEALDLPFFFISTQTYPRQQDLVVMQQLAALAAVLHKFALDFRILQSPAFGEWAEPFGSQQVGSSAMPFKRNPINSENMCSLARLVGAMPQVMWENASQAILERSLDDSANRRVVLAEGFLAMDELLLRATKIVRGMQVDKEAIGRNMATYGPFAALERLLMALVAAGADRQEAHEWLRQISLHAWQALQQGNNNPLSDLVLADERVRQFVDAGQVDELMDVSAHTGTAARRARAFAEEIRNSLPGAWE